MPVGDKARSESSQNPAMDPAFRAVEPSRDTHPRSTARLDISTGIRPRSFPSGDLDAHRYRTQTWSISTAASLGPGELRPGWITISFSPWRNGGAVTGTSYHAPARMRMPQP